MEADWPVGLVVLIVVFVGIGVGTGIIPLSKKQILVLLGALFEVGGILTGLYPDLVYGPRIANWLRTSPALDRAYRLFGLRGSRSAMPPAGALLASGVDVVVNATADLAVGLGDQVKILEKKAAALEHDVSALNAQIATLQHDLPKRLTDVEANFRNALIAKFDEYRPLRIFGVLMYFLGLAFSTWANLLE